MMVGIGIVMGIAEWMGRKTRDISGVNFVDAGTIGIAQALAVVPGSFAQRHHHHGRPCSAI
jgi:undecaprenyl-diphosphatase